MSSSSPSPTAHALKPRSPTVHGPRPRSSRFFVALRPDAPAATRLAGIGADLAMRCRGKALAADDLHVTLAFIGDRPATEAEYLSALLAGLPRTLPGFPLGSIGHFGSTLLWAGPSQTPDWLATLAETVRARLHAAGVQFDRRALRPHLTLVRNARERGLAKAASGPLAESVQVSEWELALGGTHEAATPLQRYRWQLPPAHDRGGTG
jgi:2'-5' RNA ligase